jgi:hypothetical protein
MFAAHPDDGNRAFAASRRQLIFGAALTAGLAGAAGLIPKSAAAAQSKLSQGDSGYQNRPNGGQRCELCANWQAPTSCKVVAGPISPSGWCSLFAARKS